MTLYQEPTTSQESVQVTFEWLESVLPERLDLNEIRSIDVDHHRRLLKVCFITKGNGDTRLTYEGGACYQHPAVSYHFDGKVPNVTYVEEDNGE